MAQVTKTMKHWARQIIIGGLGKHSLPDLELQKRGVDTETLIKFRDRLIGITGGNPLKDNEVNDQELTKLLRQAIEEKLAKQEVSA